MTPRERALRLADLKARQRRAQAAADGLRREASLAEAVNFILDTGVADEFHRVVAKHKDKPDPTWTAVDAALTARQHEEAAIEKQLARDKAAELREEADLILLLSRA